MTDVKDLFPEIEALDPAALHARYNTLRAECGTDPTSVPDDKLHEMVCILGVLRRKSAGPPRASAAGGAPRGRQKPEVSLEDI